MMTRPNRLPAVAYLCVFLAAADGFGQLVWRRDTGWVDVTEPPAKAALLRYRHAAGLMTLGHYASALEQLEGIPLRGMPATLRGQVRLAVAECLLRLRRFRQAADVAEEVLRAPAPGNLAAVQRLRYRIAVAAGDEQPALALDLLDDLLGFRPRARSRKAWPAGDLIGAAETYVALDRPASALRVLQRCRKVYAGRLCPPAALRLIGRIRLVAAASANAADARAEAAERAFREYLDLAPEARDASQVRQIVTWLEAVRKGTSADRRRVLYAGMRLYRCTPAEAADVYRTLEQVIRAKPGTAEAEMAAFLRASALEAMGHLEDAAEANAQFMKQYPTSRYYDQALRKAFDLGRRLLARGDEAGLEALEAVYEKDPRGPLADNALHEKARYLQRKRRYPEAVRLFRSILEDYPTSDVSAEALYRLGQATYAQSEYHPARQAIYSRAREAFELYVQRYPHGRFVEAARAAARECREHEAEHLYKVAQFYRERGNEQSAAIYMRLLREKYPGTRYAPTGASAKETEGAKP